MGKLQLVVHDHGRRKWLHRSCLSNSHIPQVKEQLLNSGADEETLMLCLHMEKHMAIVLSVHLSTGNHFQAKSVVETHFLFSMTGCHAYMHTGMLAQGHSHPAKSRVPCCYLSAQGPVLYLKNSLNRIVLNSMEKVSQDRPLPFLSAYGCLP